MVKLFCLTFYSPPSGDYREGFCIGLFASYDQADQVSLRYRKEVTGFKDFDCEAEITEVPVIGNYSDSVPVYRFVGWNENEDLDEVDILESACYVDRMWAEADYQKAQSEIPRQKWALNRYTVGQCDWQAGFVCV